MSESDGEKAARSVALEQAYVHEVYEQCAEKTAQSRPWPRIYKFLEELEPGALVCDIGCGNGKYLNVNNNVFKVGADRCKRLTDIAREKENEVLICDNLALPFRDESFDAVLSIAVVHHFATTERRVNALKELARVLRIGGRLVISVWAMEQRHRKFESQDVLVPWPKAYYLNSDSSTLCPCGKSSTGGMPCINELDPDRIAQKCLLTSKRNGGRKCKSRSYWIDPIFSPSPSTSSLSSPNETCYSFFRRALQKLAGGKRGSNNRAWFLENWQNGDCKNHQNYESDDIGDVDDIPIELRRLEDDNVTFSKLPDALSIKSKSLGDILEIQRLDLVRSRSSIPGFSSTVTSELYLDEDSKSLSLSPTPPPPPPPPPPPSSGTCALTQFSSVERTRTDEHRLEPLVAQKAPAESFSRSFSSNKPRLVKQKTHIPDDATLEFPEKPQNTAIREIITDLADIQKVESAKERRRNVHKQSSMNEELMSMERLIERDRVRRNIMKQASLNEEIICKPSRTFGNFRDSILYSGNATKRFQLIKSGLTNRFKQSTTSMEKVSSLAIKNGFVKILQGWTSSENQADENTYRDEKSENSENNNRTKDLSSKVNKNVQAGGNAASIKTEIEPIERRLSREDGSDSSKDSSLQSDTSVDSEDSFASVIFVPKQKQQRADYHNHCQQQQHHNRLYQQNSAHNHQNHHFPSLVDVTTVPVGCYQLRTTSAPPSPRIKHPPDSHGPRLKLISISPLLKQFPATSKSLPPPSPPGLSPRNLHPFADNRPFFHPSDLPPFDSLSTIRPFKSPTDVQNDCESMEDNKEGDTEDIVKDFENKEFTGCGKNEKEIGSRESVVEIGTKKCCLIQEIPAFKKTSKSIEKPEENVPRINSVELKEKADMEIKSTELKDICTKINSIELKEVSTKNNSVEFKEKANTRINSVEFKENTNTRINSIELKEKANTKIITGELAPNLDSVNRENAPDNQSEKSSTESINDDDSRRTRLNQIKELLRQKPGFATRCAKSSFPLVRRASTATSGRPETIEARTLPRLLSLELYNPETDDLDSDSSGLSSPESVGSVISVISDERFTLKKADMAKAMDTVVKPVEAAQTLPATRLIKSTNNEEVLLEDSSSSSIVSGTTQQGHHLLEATASVVNSSQDTAVLRLEPPKSRVNSNKETETTLKNPTSIELARITKIFPESMDSRNSSRCSRVSRVRDRLDTMPEEVRKNPQTPPLDDNNRLEISDNIINDIERYCKSSRLLDETEISLVSTTITDESTVTTTGNSQKSWLPLDENISTAPSQLNTLNQPDTIDLLPSVNRLRSNCKYSQLVDDTIAWLRGATGPENDDDYSEYTDNNNENLTVNDEHNIEGNKHSDKSRLKSTDEKSSIRKNISEDIMDFVMVSKNGECISMSVAMEIDGNGVPIENTSSKFNVNRDNSNCLMLDKIDDTTITDINVTDRLIDGDITIDSSRSSLDNKQSRTINCLRYGDSVESTEIEDSIGNSVSLSSSDASQTDTLSTSRLCNRACSSTTSLVSSNNEYKTLRERRKYLYQKRSASEEIPARRDTSDNSRDEENPTGTANARSGGTINIRRGNERYAGSMRTPNLSGSSSQESLLSDRGGNGGGGAITYHQYYHVFREGELDQLINKYVENLHIISSYYDHASWCIVAEKVQVWTI